MLLLTSLTLGLQLIALTYGQTPKPPFDLGNRTLEVVYNNNTLVSPPGRILGIDLPEFAPTIGLPAPSLSGTYLLIVVDPDSSRPNVLHLLQTGLTASRQSIPPFNFLPFTSSTPPITPYARPRPPVGSGYHRYTFLLISQPANFSIPAEFASIIGGNSRSPFDLGRFIQVTGLGRTIASNYFLTSNETSAASNATATATATGTGTTRSPSATSTTLPFRGGANANAVGATFMVLALLCALTYLL